MNSSTPPRPHAPRRSSALPWLLILAISALAGWFGWHAWQARQLERSAAIADQRQQLDSLERRLDAMRRDQRAQAARLQRADATNRVLRNELLGIAQRAALLENSLDKLAEPQRSGTQALHLDEVEWLLGQGMQRLHLSGDLDGARYAYALAARQLDTIVDPAFLDLRQALAQERAALDALGSDPKVVAARRLEAFSTGLPRFAPARGTVAPARDGAWWQRVLSRIVAVRRSDDTLAVDPGDRAAGYAALQLELSLARASAERRDVAGYRAALSRVDSWLRRLWPPSGALRLQRERLEMLRALPLVLDLPTLGSTRDQLRVLRKARPDRQVRHGSD
ncbi:MAG: uroporphyrinogen-III C-methyltransferase [Luteimonas sp.]